jgi:hypothetical protein
MNDMEKFMIDALRKEADEAVRLLSEALIKEERPAREPAVEAMKRVSRIIVLVNGLERRGRGRAHLIRLDVRCADVVTVASPSTHLLRQTVCGTCLPKTPMRPHGMCAGCIDLPAWT